MHSRVAQDLERERLAAELDLTPEGRIRLALQLGEESVHLYRDLHPGTTLAEAREALAARVRSGRQPSRCAAPR